METKEPFVGLADSPPIALFLFVELTGEDCWHVFDDDKPVQIPQRALYGYLTDVRISMGQWRGQPKPNLRLSFKADREYIVQSGLETSFSRGVLLALDKVENLADRLCLEVRPGGGDNRVVFSNIYLADGGVRVKTEWDRDCKLSLIVRRLQERLGTAVQTDADLRAAAQQQNSNNQSRSSAPPQSRSIERPPQQAEPPPRQDDSYDANDDDDIPF